jgi:D-alanyl-D-alanine carboxypeptidase/D-alanyl-D-alanine-endopeptidase (penicillin-binding protein 4)
MKYRRPVVRSRRTLGALAFCAIATAWALVPAAAVDRTLGADVPKPSAVGASWSPTQQSSLARDLDAQIAAAATLKGSHVGILAIDARDGTVLYNRNGNDAFMPASTFKILTGSAALERLGPAFRIRTVAFAEGSVQTGVLHGRLVVRGGGDPLLRAADFDDLAAALKRAGIGRIDGPIDIDTSYFADPPYMPGWSWDDFPYYYAPKISAFSFDENVVHLTIAPASTAGMRATITAAPYGRVGDPLGGCALTSDVIVLPHVMTGAPGSADSVDLERDPGGCIIVKGKIPLDAAPETVDAAVPSPEVYAWHVLVDRLHAHGIASTTPRSYPGFAQSVVAAPASANARVVWTHDSEPLSDLLADMWLPSDNLLAELLLKSLGAATGEPGTAANGVAYETQWLRTLGIDVAPLSIDDGSGLSAYDRMTPRALVAILKHDWNAPTRETVLDDLPIAGVRGTLKSSFIGTLAEKTVFAKTGSVSHVRTLAGYAATQVHGAVIFAFQVDDWTGTEIDLNSIRASLLSRIIGDS